MRMHRDEHRLDLRNDLLERGRWKSHNAALSDW
jgi:hypothetical protein